jgi:hypothetical protein
MEPVLFVKSAPLTINQHVDTEALCWLVASPKAVQAECSNDDTMVKRLVGMTVAVGADGRMSVCHKPARYGYGRWYGPLHALQNSNKNARRPLTRTHYRYDLKCLTSVSTWPLQAPRHTV